MTAVKRIKLLSITPYQVYLMLILLIILLLLNQVSGCIRSMSNRLIGDIGVGIEPMTSWLVTKKSDPSVKEAVYLTEMHR